MLQSMPIDADDIFTILEDDFLTCSNAEKYINEMLIEIERVDTNWVALKTSFGGNGMFAVKM